MSHCSTGSSYDIGGQLAFSGTFQLNHPNFAVVMIEHNGIPFDPFICDVADIPFLLVFLEEVVHLLQAATSLQIKLVLSRSMIKCFSTVSGINAHTMGIQTNVRIIQIR